MRYYLKGFSFLKTSVISQNTVKEILNLLTFYFLQKQNKHNFFFAFLEKIGLTRTSGLCSKIASSQHSNLEIYNFGNIGSLQNSFLTIYYFGTFNFGKFQF